MGKLYLGTQEITPLIYDKAEDIVPREIVNGKIQISTGVTSYELPSGVNSVGDYALGYLFRDSQQLTTVDLSGLTTTNTGSFIQAFYGCSNLTSVDISSLVYASGSSSFSGAFQNCTSLASVDLSSLKTISNGVFSNAFNGCTSLTSIDLSSLEEDTNGGWTGMFQNCSNLSSVNLSSLETAHSLASTFSKTALTSVSFTSLAFVKKSRIFSQTFNNCASLTTVSFPALTTNSFGTYKNQFETMLYRCTDVTVHFPSNLSSLIPTFDGYPNFGGTNTTVLFDL